MRQSTRPAPSRRGVPTRGPLQPSHLLNTPQRRVGGAIFATFRAIFPHSVNFRTFCQNLENVETQNGVPGSTAVAAPPHSPAGIRRAALLAHSITAHTCESHQGSVLDQIDDFQFSISWLAHANSTRPDEKWLTSRPGFGPTLKAGGTRASYGGGHHLSSSTSVGLTIGVPRSEEMPPPLGSPYGPRHSPTVGS